MSKNHTVHMRRDDVEAITMQWKRSLLVAFGHEMNQGDGILIVSVTDSGEFTNDPFVKVLITLVETADPLPLPKPYSLVHIDFTRKVKIPPQSPPSQQLPRALDDTSFDMAQVKPRVVNMSAPGALL